MEICSGKHPNYHEEICWDGSGSGNCPMCNLMKENKDLLDQIEVLEKERE